MQDNRKNPSAQREWGKKFGSFAMRSVKGAFTDLTPNISQSVVSATDMAREGKTFISRTKSAIVDQTKALDRNNIGRSARNVLEGAFKDMQNDDYAFDKYSDDTFGDMNDLLGDLDAGIDENDPEALAKQETRKNTAVLGKVVASGNAATISGMKRMSKSISSATLKASEIQTSKLTNVAMFGINRVSTELGTLSSQVAVSNANLSAIVKFQNQNVNEMHRASLEYYDKSLSVMTKMGENIAAISDQLTKMQETRNPRRRKDDFSFTNGFDFYGYKDFVKNNFNNSMIGSLLGIAKMGTGMAGGMGGSIGDMIGQGIVKTLIPKGIKKSIGSMDKNFNRTLNNLLYTMGDWGNDYGNPLKQMLGEMLGKQRPRYSKAPNLANFKRGAMSWNGEAQKTLIEVIPGYLARIEQALTGKEAKYYDMNRGTFKNESTIRNQFNADYNRSREMGMSESVDALVKALKESGIGGDEQKKAMQEMNALLNSRLTDEIDTRKFRSGTKDILGRAGMSKSQVSKSIFDMEDNITETLEKMNDMMENLSDVYRTQFNQFEKKNSQLFSNTDFFGRSASSSFTSFMSESEQRKAEKERLQKENAAKYKGSMKSKIHSKIHGFTNNKNGKFYKNLSKAGDHFFGDPSKRPINQDNFFRKLDKFGSARIDDLNSVLLDIDDLVAEGHITPISAKDMKDAVVAKMNAAKDDFHNNVLVNNRQSQTTREFKSRPVRKATSRLAARSSAAAGTSGIQKELRKTNFSYKAALKAKPEEYDDKNLDKAITELDKIANESGNSSSSTGAASSRLSKKQQGGDTAAITAATNTGLLLTMQKKFLNPMVGGLFGDKGFFKKLTSNEHVDKVTKTLKDKLFDEKDGIFNEFTKGWKDSVDYMKYIFTGKGYKTRRGGKTIPDSDNSVVGHMKNAYDFVFSNTMKYFFGDDYKKNKNFQKYFQWMDIKNKKKKMTPETDAESRVASEVFGPPRAPEDKKSASIIALPTSKNETKLLGDASKAAKIIDINEATTSKNSKSATIVPFTPQETVSKDVAEASAKIAEEMGEKGSEFVEKNFNPSEKEQEKVQNKLNQGMASKLKKILPKALAAAGIGGILASSIGFSGAGLLGALTLPTTFMGGAIAAGGLTFLSQSETFKKFVFGDLDKDGKRIGGILSNKFQQSMKKALPIIVGGGVLGAIRKYAFGSAIGLAGGSTGGFILNTLLPGGPVGGALLGMGIGLLKNNEKFQSILFGKKGEDGKSFGGIFSKSKNFMSSAFMGASKYMKNGVKGLAGGALTGATLAQFGVLGSAMSLGGPVGMGLLGLGVGIAGTAKKFNQLLFGTTEYDENGNPKRKIRNGIMDKVRNMLVLNMIEPVKNRVAEEMTDFAYWAKEKISYPFRQAFGPIFDGLKGIKENVTDYFKEKFDKFTNNLGIFMKETIGKIFHPFTSIVGKIGSGLLKVLNFGMKASLSPVTAPLKMLEIMTMPKRAREKLPIYKNILKHGGGALMDKWGQDNQYESNRRNINKERSNILKEHDIKNLSDADKDSIRNRLTNAGMGKDHIGKDDSLIDFLSDSQGWEERHNLKEDKGLFSGFRKLKKRAGDVKNGYNAAYEGFIEGLEDTGEGDVKNHLNWMRVGREKKDLRKQKEHDKNFYKNRRELIKLSRKYAKDDKFGETKWTDSRMREMQKKFGKLGIKKEWMSSQEDLHDLIYDFEGWKEKFGIAKGTGAEYFKGKTAKVPKMEFYETEEQRKARIKTSDYQDQILSEFEAIRKAFYKMGFEKGEDDLQHRSKEKTQKEIKKMKDTLKRRGMNLQDIGLSEEELINMGSLPGWVFDMYRDSDDYGSGNFKKWYKTNMADREDAEEDDIHEAKVNTNSDEDEDSKNTSEAGIMADIRAEARKQTKIAADEANIMSGGLYDQQKAVKGTETFSDSEAAETTYTEQDREKEEAADKASAAKISALASARGLASKIKNKIFGGTVVAEEGEESSDDENSDDKKGSSVKDKAVSFTKSFSGWVEGGLKGLFEKMSEGGWWGALGLGTVIAGLWGDKIMSVAGPILKPMWDAASSFVVNHIGPAMLMIGNVITKYAPIIADNIATVITYTAPTIIKTYATVMSTLLLTVGKMAANMFADALHLPKPFKLAGDDMSLDTKSPFTKTSTKKIDGKYKVYRDSISGQTARDTNQGKARVLKNGTYVDENGDERSVSTTPAWSSNYAHDAFNVITNSRGARTATLQYGKAVGGAAVKGAFKIGTHLPGMKLIGKVGSLGVNKGFEIAGKAMTNKAEKDAAKQAEEQLAKKSSAKVARVKFGAKSMKNIDNKVIDFGAKKAEKAAIKNGEEKAIEKAVAGKAKDEGIRKATVSAIKKAEAPKKRMTSWITTHFKTIIDALKKCGPVKKYVKPIVNAFESLKTTILDHIKISDDGFISKLLVGITKKTEKGAAKTATSLIPVVGWIVQAGFTVYDLASGALEAASLFEVDEDDVTAGMRVVSSLMKGIMGIGPMFLVDISFELFSALSGKNAKKWIATKIYSLLNFWNDNPAKLKKAQANFAQEVKNYNYANKTNLNTTSYMNLKNKKTKTHWYNKGPFSLIFGSGEKKEDFTKYEVKNSSKSATVGNGTGSSGAVGYGNSQYDSRWGNYKLGKFSNGQTSTMASGGCGPTALANITGQSPLSVAKLATDNGYISDGGANAKLFTEGAASMGLSSKKITSKTLKSELKSGKPVIIAGKSNLGNGLGYGADASPYTKAGHILSVTGIDKNTGKAIVQDPMHGGSELKSLDSLTKGMTDGWSYNSKAVGNGNGPLGFGFLGSVGKFFSGVGNTIDKGLKTAQNFVNNDMAEFFTKAEDVVGDTIKSGVEHILPYNLTKGLEVIMANGHKTKQKAKTVKAKANNLSSNSTSSTNGDPEVIWISGNTADSKYGIEFANPKFYLGLTVKDLKNVANAHPEILKKDKYRLFREVYKYYVILKKRSNTFVLSNENEFNALNQVILIEKQLGKTGKLTSKYEYKNGFPFFRNKDSRWASMSWKGKTIGERGSDISSLAMLASAFGNNIIPPNYIYNQWLQDNKSWWSKSGGLNEDEVFKDGGFNSLSSTFKKNKPLRVTKARNLATIMNALRHRKPVYMTGYRFANSVFGGSGDPSKVDTESMDARNSLIATFSNGNGIAVNDPRSSLYGNSTFNAKFLDERIKGSPTGHAYETAYIVSDGDNKGLGKNVDMKAKTKPKAQFEKIKGKSLTGALGAIAHNIAAMAENSMSALINGTGYKSIFSKKISGEKKMSVSEIKKAHGDTKAAKATHAITTKHKTLTKAQKTQKMFEGLYSQYHNAPDSVKETVARGISGSTGVSTSEVLNYMNHKNYNSSKHLAKPSKLTHKQAKALAMPSSAEKGTGSAITAIGDGEKSIGYGKKKKSNKKKKSKFKTGDFSDVTGSNSIEKTVNKISVLANAAMGTKAGMSYQKSRDKILAGLKAKTASGTSGSANADTDGINANGSIKGSALKKKIWNFFTQLGYSDAATAGIMGNIQQENGAWDPARHQSGGPAAGLFQWENANEGTGRWANLNKFAQKHNKFWTDWKTQAAFADLELRSGMDSYFRQSKTRKDQDGKTYTVPATTYEKWMRSTDPGVAAMQFEGAFERAGKPWFAHRIAAAKRFYELYHLPGKGLGPSGFGAAAIFNLPIGYGTATYNNGITANDVITVAKSQVGYLEKSSNNSLEDFTANVGQNNFTKYGKFYGANGQPWCGSFVSWCFTKAANGSKKKAANALCGSLYAACSAGAAKFRSCHQWLDGSQIPEAGDVIFFAKSRGGHEYHTGIVIKVADGIVYTVEGNTSSGSLGSVEPNGGAVAQKKYPIGAPKITGYGRPRYDGTSAFNGDCGSTLADSASTKKATTKTATGTGISNPFTDKLTKILGKVTKSAAKATSKKLGNGVGEYFEDTLGGVISSGYGKRGSKYHRGLDIGAQMGSAIHTPVGGTVIDNGNDPKGYGNYVAIKDHNGMNHIFGHMNSKSKLPVGYGVNSHDIIGEVGSTGNSTGSHLHYEVRKGSDKYSSIDPSRVNYNSAKGTLNINNTNFKSEDEGSIGNGTKDLKVGKNDTVIKKLNVAVKTEGVENKLDILIDVMRDWAGREQHPTTIIQKSNKSVGKGTGKAKKSSAPKKNKDLNDNSEDQRLFNIHEAIAAK